MAKHRSNVSVSWHDASSQFVKWVGKTRGKDGKLRPKSHYLGTNRNAAIAQAIALIAQWKTLKSSGAQSWPDLEPAKTSIDVEPQKTPLTVEQAAKEYLETIQAERDAKQVTREHYESMRYKIARVVSYMGPKKTIVSIGEKELIRFVHLVAQRPNVQERKSNPIRPMSVAYARKVVAAAKGLFIWLYESARWNNRPRNFDRLFRFKPVVTTAEREARLNGINAEPPFFTVDELARLYQVACDRHRLWILLALNCGFAQAELDSLNRFEIKGLSTEKPYIERYRKKTEVYGRWSLWPETADLLAKYMAPPNDDDIALLTDRGRRLKSVVRSGVYSGVSVAWARIVKRCGVTGKSFKLLRKTGAWMTKKISGKDVSEMYLAHQEPGMNKAYAGRRWETLDAALVEMRQQLEPMFAAGGHCGHTRFQQSIYNESNGLLPFPRAASVYPSTSQSPRQVVV